MQGLVSSKGERERERERERESSGALFGLDEDQWGMFEGK